MHVRLKRATFFDTRVDHTFHFEFYVGEPGQFTVPVVTQNVGNGLDAQWLRAHENLVTTLERALEAAQSMLAERQGKIGPDAIPPTEI